MSRQRGRKEGSREGAVEKRRRQKVLFEKRMLERMKSEFSSSSSSSTSTSTSTSKTLSLFFSLSPAHSIDLNNQAKTALHPRPGTTKPLFSPSSPGANRNEGHPPSRGRVRGSGSSSAQLLRRGHVARSRRDFFSFFLFRLFFHLDVAAVPLIVPRKFLFAA